MPIHPHNYLIPIGEEEILWRYIDLPKLTSLLRDRCLFFCRADKFSDPFECSTPKREYQYREVVAFGRSQQDTIRAKQQVEEMSNFFQRAKRATVVNSWHINTNESDAMWRLYLKTSEGVAIQSNISRIKEALQETPELLYSSKVRYINYETDIYHHPIDYPVTGLNTITPVIHKRIEFSHEAEFRIFYDITDAVSDINGIYWESQPNPLGRYFIVNPNLLIDKIVFAPTADNYCKEKIKKIVKEAGYVFQFKESTLSNIPLY